MLLECLAAAGRWSEASAHCDSLYRLAPPKDVGSQKAIAAWKAAGLVHVGMRAREGMTKLQSEFPDAAVKVHAWLSFAAHCTEQHDALAARQAALEASEGQPPLLRADCLIEVAEWLQGSGSAADGTAAEALLAQAADLLLVGPPAPRAPRRSSMASSSPRSPRSPRDGRRASAVGFATAAEGQGAATSPGRAGAPAAMAAAAGAASGAAAAKQLPSSFLDRLIRVHTALGQVAASPAARREALVTAQQYASQLLQQALLDAGINPAGSAAADKVAAAAAASAAAMAAATAAAEVAAGQAADAAADAAAAAATSPAKAPAASKAAAKPGAVAGKAAPVAAAAAPAAAVAAAAPRPASPAVQARGELPGHLQEWAGWTLDAPTLARLRASGSGVAMTPQNLGSPERLLASLRLLVEALQAQQLVLQCLPLCHLMRLVALVALGSEVRRGGSMRYQGVKGGCASEVPWSTPELTSLTRGRLAVERLRLLI